MIVALRGPAESRVLKDVKESRRGALVGDGHQSGMEAQVSGRREVRGREVVEPVGLPWGARSLARGAVKVSEAH